jgi:hypothetical protein
MRFDWGITPPAHLQLSGELTSWVEQCRADYHRLKAADKEITRAELSEARAAYEHALVHLSGLLDYTTGLSASYL